MLVEFNAPNTIDLKASDRLQLPELNLRDIARSLATQAPQGQVLATLLILEGQFLLAHKNNGAHEYKFISPALLKQAFASEAIDSQWLPPNTVRWGRGKKGEWLMQYYPLQKYCIPLLDANDSTFDITIPMPGLLFTGCGTDYYIWATKGRQFDPDAKLYKAPLPNTDDDGKICFGGNSKPVCSAATIFQAWTLFWAAPFNNHMANSKSIAFPQDVREHLLQLHNKKSKRYPISDLVESSRKLNDIVNFLS
ncbi:hypothetical protein WA1_49055 [Scytonema hofmannii PCC 7110]|uniref:PRTRC system protein B n=1 Tax=Scytonema hofmannii PCC 7110 TaxID=128403 RepID=A0A139WQI2_9CYAN|nr:hypothetical protein [Scytonema hofmannii]KYC34691.1 hypothetical protein WA1_49055 [Scytonema hofmannii PCC 7110]